MCFKSMLLENFVWELANANELNNAYILFCFSSPSLMQFFLECPGYVKYIPQVNLAEQYRKLATEMWSKKRY